MENEPTSSNYVEFLTIPTTLHETLGEKEYILRKFSEML